MKNKFISIVVSTLLLVSCNTKKPFHEAKVDNPEFIPNTAFVSSEDLSSPKFQELREKFQLDTIFHGEKDELKRILLLRDWIRKVIRISDYSDTYPGDGYAEGILDAALKGYGFHCGHYMIVQNAVMNAYGYVTRCLGAGPGVKGGPDGHHGINEIWLDKYHKWFLSDAKYNHYFEKNGIPLSALEIRDEYLKNRMADVLLLKGAARTPIEFDGVVNKKGEMVKVTKADFAQTYTWIEWEKSNNRFTVWPAFDSKLNMYQDDYFKNHTWIWDGKPHWAYNKPEYMNRINERKAIEWTPNTISSKVTLDGNKARIELQSNTPNLKTYQMKENPGEEPAASEWKDIAATTTVELKKDTNEILFRTKNLAGVTGAEHKIIIER
jgi:hypothetical protein